MARRYIFMRRFAEAYARARAIGSEQELAIFSHVEDTILDAKWTLTSPDIVAFLYNNATMPEKDMAEAYREQFWGSKGMNSLVTVRNKRSNLSGLLYEAFGNDFFDVLLIDKNYEEINWRRNLVNAGFSSSTTLVTDQVIDEVRNYAKNSTRSDGYAKNHNSSSKNAVFSGRTALHYIEGTDGVYSLDACENEVKFLTRYLNVMLTLNDGNVSKNKLLYLVQALNGEFESTSPGTRFEVMSKLLEGTPYKRPSK